MKNLLYILLLSFIFSSCISSKKYLERGLYDKAVETAVKKLMRKSDKSDEIAVLQKAYKIANDADNERINYLKKSGQPDIWEEIMVNFRRLSRRQNTVKKLPDNILSQINYKEIDYSSELISAKRKATEYHYSYGNSLLEKGDKSSARQAYDEFIKVKQSFNNYKDVDDKINQAMYYGTSNILFKIKIKNYLPLPPNFSNEIKNISLSNLNERWLNFDTREDTTKNYDYIIRLTIDQIDVSPEHVRELYYDEARKVDDGWEYEKDADGKVITDSLGNKIKIPVYREVHCHIKEYILSKQASISGNIDFINDFTNKLIKTEPIMSETYFEYVFAEYEGDPRAMKIETKRKTLNEPVPFPHDFDMIFDAGEVLKEIAKNIIRRNRSLIY